jgi:hypothetical protein
LIFGGVRWAARKECAASGKRDDASEEQESRESKIAQNKPTTRARGKLKNFWESGFSSHVKWDGIDSEKM